MVMGASVRRIDVTWAVMMLFSQEIEGSFNVSKLRGMFPVGYSSEAAPDVFGKPTKVRVSMVVLDAGSVTESDMDFQLHVYLIMKWRDPRLLLFDELGPSGLVMPAEVRKRLWHPSVSFENAVVEHTLSGHTGAIVLRNHQRLISSTRYNLKVHCKIDLSIYPVDTQRCALYFRSSGEDNSKVYLYWADHASSGLEEIQKSVTMYREPTDGRFLVETPAPSSFNRSLLTGQFAFLYIPFVFRRQMTSRVLKTYLPSSLVVMLSWASFWIDVESISGRVLVVTTSVLTVTMQIAKDKLGFARLNALDIWNFACELLVCAAVLELAIAYSIAKRNMQRFRTEQLSRMAKHAGFEQTEVTSLEGPRHQDTVSTTVPRQGQEHPGAAKDSKDAPGGPLLKAPQDDNEGVPDPEVREQDLEMSALVSYLKLKRRFGDPRISVDILSRVVFPCLFFTFVIWYWASLLFFTIVDYKRDQTEYFETWFH
nr:putative histamine-gated chloride channel, his-16 [Ixodes ricinus]